MRTGACTVQQALAAEAASVLKQSLNLARRRGHAQVTPLHVAATLLSSSSSFSNLLRRACLKSQPHHPASHPLQCRALELCFNVALNRLPTNPPPSSGSLIQPQPSLSNALIAALKRAQAHQRRGCIELQQHQQQQQPAQQQQQPLLAIKVELEQLILSILDDPSVSRVMREAGFSSNSVKSNLEDETSVLVHTPPFLFESPKDMMNQGSNFWQAPLLKLPSGHNPTAAPQSSLKEDLKVVLDVMLRRQGRRTSVVAVGDSVSMTEGLVAELSRRVERGEVPEELKSASFINLQLSYVHLRLMNKNDVDLKLSDLRRKISSLASDGAGGSVIIYAGDLRWAVDEEAKDGCRFKPVEHMVAELGRLLPEFRSSLSNDCGVQTSKIWLLATASFQTYMRCQMRQPSLENQWDLQAVVVPSGGLSLTLQASSGLESRVPKASHNGFHLFEPKAFDAREDEKLVCCAECTSNFEKEASAVKSDVKGTHSSSHLLPSWLQPPKPENDQKDASTELRRKWHRLCQKLHQNRNSHAHLFSQLFNQNLITKDNSLSHSLWANSKPSSHITNFLEPHSISFSSVKTELNGGFCSSSNIVDGKNSTDVWQEKDEPKQWLSQSSFSSRKLPAMQEVGTTLALGSILFSDSATFKDETRQVMADLTEVRKRLQENIPWQSKSIPRIIEAFKNWRSSEKSGMWALIHGSDHIAKRRLAQVMVDSFVGSADRLIRIRMKASDGRTTYADTIREALEKQAKSVFLIEGVNGAFCSDVIESIMDGLKAGPFEVSGRREILADAVFIVVTSDTTESQDAGDNSEAVLKMRLLLEVPSSGNLKRKPEEEDVQQNTSKKPRRAAESPFDLNIIAEEAASADEDVATASSDLLLPRELLESTVQFTLHASDERGTCISESIQSKLLRAFDEVCTSNEQEEGHLSFDLAAVEELADSAGFFSESLFERWVSEVFRKSLVEFKHGGNVRLVAEGKEGNVGELGFMGSVLPKRLHLG